MKYFVIYSPKETSNNIETEPLFWVLGFGWGSLSSANVWTEEETKMYGKLLEGEWLELPEIKENI